MGIWQQLHAKAKALQRPVFVLAPMADVTDASFRKVIATYGMPDALWTEFVSADGLKFAPEEGRQKLLKDLIFDSKIEHPIIAQFFTSRAESMYEAARLAVRMGFDGVDINMGCPDKSIEKQKCGAAMIKNPELARDVILSAKKGVEDESKELGVPLIDVSVKTRVGFSKVELETWLPWLLQSKPALITLHCRTRKEMSKVPARWEHVKRGIEIRNEIQKDIHENERTLIFGNGDVQTIEEGIQKYREFAAEGVMIGRGIFGNPFLFHRDGAGNFDSYQPTLKEKVIALKEHIIAFDDILGETKNFALMKKHFKSYLLGFDHAKDARIQLMDAENAKQALEMIDSLFVDIL